MHMLLTAATGHFPLQQRGYGSSSTSSSSSTFHLSSALFMALYHICLLSIICLPVVTYGTVEDLDCKGSDPCVYLGKDKGLGWRKIIENEDPLATKPFPPKSNSWARSDTTIFVSISSFRDKLCPKTLFNIYTKAAYPERITVGVVQQNEDIDIDCLKGYCELIASSGSTFSSMKRSKKYESSEGNCPFSSNIRVDKRKASEAQGPTWARALGKHPLILLSPNIDNCSMININRVKTGQRRRILYAN